jgi:methylmalonyl-CoA carboxyltransferase 12S subunit
MEYPMESEVAEPAEIIEAIDSLRREMARLSERTAALEVALADQARPSTRQPDGQRVAEGLSEELMLVISAAIAAFLGVKPRIRQIVLLQSNPWSQQGRVTIQASRALSIHHG